MKKRVLSFLALLMCAVLVLGSCGASFKKPAFDDVYATSEDAAAQWTNQNLSFDGASFAGQVGNLVYFVSTGDDGLVTHTVYNLATGANVVSIKDSMTVTNEIMLYAFDKAATYLDVSYFTVTATDASVEETTTKLFDASNNQLGEAADGEVAPTMNANLILFDDVYYVAKDGGISKLVEKSPLAKELPAFGRYNDTYYYAVGERTVDVYSAETLTLAKSFAFSSRYDESEWFVLQNGNILFQGGYRLPDDAADFERLDDEKKLAYDTLIFDVASGETKKINFEYKVSEVYANGSPEYQYQVEEGTAPVLAEDVENIFIVSPLVDKYIEESAYDAKAYLVNNNGKITGDLSAYLEVNAAVLPEPAKKNGYFFLTDASGSRYLLQADGTVVGEVAETVEANANFFVAGGKIFDYTLATLLDYEKDSYELVAVLADTILLSKEITGDAAGTEYSLYKADGGLTVLFSTDKKANLVSFEEDYVIFNFVEGSVAKYTVLATDGSALISSNTGIVKVASIENAVIFGSMNDEGKPVYYRISK